MWRTYKTGDCEDGFGGTRDSVPKVPAELSPVWHFPLATISSTTSPFLSRPFRPTATATSRFDVKGCQYIFLALEHALQCLAGCFLSRNMPHMSFTVLGKKSDGASAHDTCLHISHLRFDIAFLKRKAPAGVISRRFPCGYPERCCSAVRSSGIWPTDWCKLFGTVSPADETSVAPHFGSDLVCRIGDCQAMSSAVLGLGWGVSFRGLCH